ncbi:chaplin [Streptomyces sp. NBC_00210]
MGAAAPAMADGDAIGSAVGSPGVLSGNVLQIPVMVPVNACGNSLNLIALLNPTMGNACIIG